MPATRRRPAQVRALVRARSRGVCEYGTCNKLVIEVIDGKCVVTGHISHIIPVGDGPRAKYRNSFDIELEDPDNLMLLCYDHHNLIDKIDIEGHPPDALFTMVTRKADGISQLLQDHIDDLSEDVDVEYIVQSTEVSFILDIIEKYRSVDSTRGATALSEARRVISERLKSPFADHKYFYYAIRIAIDTLEAMTSYSQERWETLFARCEQLFRKIKSDRIAASLTLNMLVFVRNEYGALDRSQRTGMVGLLISRINDALSRRGEEGKVLARLLAIKASLLRWQGRLERDSHHRTLRFDESERCASKSLSARWSGLGQLQHALTVYSRALMRPLREAKTVRDEIERVFEEVMDSKLDNSPITVKYRPRILRDTYQHDEAIQSFWSAIHSGFRWDMGLVAYTLAESSVAKISYPNSTLRDDLPAILEFVEESLSRGFCHGRNVMAWAVLHSVLDPEWFRSQIFEALKNVTSEHSKTGRPDWCSIMAGSRTIGDGSISHDLLFGIDNCHFWTMVARTTRIALDDAPAAAELYSVAGRYAETTSHHFAIHVGLARCHIQRGQLERAQGELASIRNFARGFQAPVVQAIEVEIRDRVATASGT